MNSFERQQQQQWPASARQTVAKSRGGLQKLAPPKQQQQVAANNKIDYDGARARNGRELEKENLTTTTFVIYENLNANINRHRGHRGQEAAPRPEQRTRVERSQEDGHLLSSSVVAVKTKIATSQEQQQQQSKSAEEWSRVVLPSPSSGQREEQQVASFECRARQMRGSGQRNSDNHLIRLKLRCQDDQQATAIVIDRQQQQQQREKMKMSSRQKNQVLNSNYAPNSAIKIHNHLMNGAHEQQPPPPLPSPTTASSGSPLSPQNHHNLAGHNHLLLGTANGQTCSSASSTINNRNTHTLNSHRSTRSTATDSSGFSSEASTTSCRTSSSQNNHHQQQQQVATNSQRASGCGGGGGGGAESNKSAKSSSSLIRSRLIEDLNRLERIAAAAARAQRAGDHHHHVTSTASTPAATLSRTSHVELDYSTLCRDEFSSFIAYRGVASDLEKEVRDNQQIDQAGAGVAATSVPSQEHEQEQVPKLLVKKMSEKRHRASKQRSHKSSSSSSGALGGPMLVGVHECETPRHELTERVPDSARSVSSSAPSSSSSNPSSPDQNNLNSACSSSSPIASLSTGGSHDDNDDDDDQEYREQFGSDEDLDDEIRLGQAKAASLIDYKNNNHLLSRQVSRTHEAHIEEYFSDESDHHHSEQQNHRLYDQQDQDRLSSLEDEDQDYRQLQASQQLPARPDYKLELNLLPKKGAGEEDKLGEMLDVYLSRVESLLRLAKGDKSIKLNEMSIGELDGLPKAAGDKRSERLPGEIEVSEEFKTRIAYVPSPRRVDKLPEVIQEMEILDEETRGGEEEDFEEKSFFLTNIVSDNFRALLSSPQTSAKLNWWPNQLEAPPAAAAAAAVGTDQLLLPVAGEHEVNFIDEHKRQVLEQSFLESWLELSRHDQQQVGESREPNNKQRHYESLVKTIRRHMGDFVSSYNTYQATMREETSFASDWHANWLFSTTRTMPKSSQQQQQQQQQQVANKRAKLMSSAGKEHCQTSQMISESNELLNYSTLLLAKYKPIKVAFVDSDDKEQEDDSDRREGAKYKRQIDTCYEEQPEQVDELQQTFLALNGQVNVCQLMLSDSFADSDQSLELEDNEDDEQLGGRGERKPLEISYETSLRAGRPLVDGQLMSFRAHGHLFELRRLRQFFNLPPALARSSSSSSSSHRQLQTRRKLEALKQLVLARLLRACQHHHGRKLDLVASQLPHRQVQRDQVRFLVHVSSLQVSQSLPVIQFCAKITGALPIRVSWHKRVEDEDSYCELTRSQIEGSHHHHEWPLTMQANYELEYENKWLSWYRFRRRHGELLFEIREPSALHDYDKTYKCVIENYCSIRECEFTLQVVKRAEASPKRELSSSENTHRPRVSAAAKSRRLAKSALNAGQEEEDELGKVRLNRVESGQGESQEAGQAILRTWSQRTLNKRAPLVASGDHHLLEPLVESQQSKQFALGQQSQTHVGRLSGQVQDECKFGTNYPYHPVSLMKRLEENKLSITLGSRLRNLSSGGMTSSEDTDRYYDLTTTTTTTAADEQDEQQLDFMRPQEVVPTTRSDLQRQYQRQGLEDKKDEEQYENSTSSGNSPANFRPTELEMPTPRPRHKPVVMASEPRQPLGELIESKNHREPLEEEETVSSSSAFANQVARDDCAMNCERRGPVGDQHHGQSTVGRVAQVDLCQSTPRANNDDQGARQHHHHLTFERTNARPALGDGEQSRAARLGSGKLADSGQGRPSLPDHDEQDDDYDDGRLASEQQKLAREEVEVVKPKSVRSLISRFNMG